MDLAEILQRQPVWRGSPALAPVPAVPTGFGPLDAELPGGGWPTGVLTEILANAEGIGELQLLLPALARLTSAGKRVMWLAPPHVPYAPGLSAAGVDLSNLAVVRAPGHRDALWAAEQTLRAASCRGFVAWFPEARYAELRRLALAAEASAAFVAIFRPLAAAHESSPAALRMALEASRDGLAVRILKRRGAPAAAPLHLHVKRPAHALGRPVFPSAPARHAREPRRLDLPVHA
jgi:hypothetical protein